MMLRIEHFETPGMRSRRLYKYVVPARLGDIFATNDHVALKCALPKEFNDPYELFLTVDFDTEPDVLAFYAEAVGAMPQLPTTCFSKSPAVVPMWAHYADNSRGFVIEVDEAALTARFTQASFGDIQYSDRPDDGLTELLHRACRIGKPRYVYLLHRGVFHAAYFTKNTWWRYEKERRIVVAEADVRTDGAVLLLDVPNSCITALIAGPRTDTAVANELRRQAGRIGCGYYRLKIGRTTARPFFVDGDGAAFCFGNGRLKASSAYCESCQEPLTTEAFACSWCQIDDVYRRQAAATNPYRVMDRLGLLETYIRDMDAVGERRQKK